MFFHSQSVMNIAILFNIFSLTTAAIVTELPVLQDAQFEPQHQELIVSFLPELFPNARVSYYSICDHIFIEPFLTNLGPKAICYMISHTEIKVHLIGSKDINIGMPVDINTTKLIGNESVVVNTTHFLDVKVVISKPFTTTYCKNNANESATYISADLSYNYGYQQLQLYDGSWNITNGGGTIEIIDDLFIKYTPAQINGSTVLDDETTNIKIEANFTIFNETMLMSTVDFPLHEEDYIPYFQVNVGSLINMKNRFRAALTIKYPFCWPEKKGPDLFFSLTQSPSQNILLKNVKTNKDTDLIGQPGDFSFKVDKEFKPTITFSTSRSSLKPATINKDVKFTIKPRPSKIMILGGGRYVSRHEKLNLTAYVDNPDGNDDGTILWECFQSMKFEEEEENRCMLNDEVPLSFGNSKITSFLFQGQLKVKESLFFRFTQKRGGMEMSAVVNVKYEIERFPSVYAYAKKPAFYLHEDIVFYLELVGTFYSVVVMEINECINMLDTDRFPQDILPNHLKFNITYTSKFQNTIMHARKFNMILPKGLFPIGSYVRCSFSFKVTDLNDDTVVYLEPVEEYIKIIPTEIHPHLSVYPAEGYAWQTKFLIRAHGWTSKEEELPLLFRFGYIDKNDTNRTVYLTAWNTINYIFDIRLPVLSNLTSKSNLTIFAEVKNQHGFQTVVEKDIILNVNSTKPENLFQDIQMEYIYYLKIDNLQLSNAVYLLRSFEMRYDPAEKKSLILFDHFVTEFVAANVYSDTGRQALDLLHYLAMTYEETNETNTVLEGAALVLTTIASADVLKLWDRDFDYLKILTKTLEWMNKVIANSANFEAISQAIKDFLSFFPQKVCSSLEMGYTTHFLKPYKSTFPYINVNIYREKFIDNLNEKNTVFVREAVVKTEETTVDELYQLEKVWGTWGCSKYIPHGCNGYCFSEVHYHRNISLTVEGNLKENYDLITDMYELGFYNPDAVRFSDTDYDDMNPRYAVSRTRQDDYMYRMIIPVKAPNISHNDHMRCHTVNLKTNNLEGGGYCIVREQLILDDPSKGNKSSFSLDCNCKKLGRVVGIRDIVPTEKPTLSDSLNISLYFWGKRDRCEDATKRKSLLDVLLPELAIRLRIDRTRVKYIRCAYDNTNYIMMYIRIIDVMGKKRVYDIEVDVQQMIQFHWTKKLHFLFDDGRKDEVELYNIDNTTPKPPPPTLPAFTDVTTYWIPMILGVISIVGIFLSCVILIFCIHTRNLKEEVFTNINSDQPPENMSEEERIRQMNRRAKEQRLNEITNEAISLEMRNKTKKTRSKIGPIGDSNAVAITVYAPKEPIYTDTVDEPKQFYALDDSDEDESEVGSRNYGFEIESSRNSVVQSSSDLNDSILDQPTSRTELISSMKGESENPGTGSDKEVNGQASEEAKPRGETENPRIDETVNNEQVAQNIEQSVDEQSLV